MLDTLGEKEIANTQASKAAADCDAEALELGIQDALAEGEARDEKDSPAKPARVRIVLAPTHNYQIPTNNHQMPMTIARDLALPMLMQDKARLRALVLKY